MSDSASPIPPPINIVGDDISCTRCGYSLQGLPVLGKCPECGWPVEASLHGNQLRYADPAYLKSLSVGALTVVIAILANVVVGLGVVLLIVVAAFSAGAFAAGPAGGRAAIPALAWIIPLGGFLQAMVLVAAAVGYWRLTEPDPGMARTEQPGAARRVARIAAIVSICAQLGDSGFEVMESMAATGAAGSTVVPTFLGLIHGVVGLIGLAAWVVQFFAMMRYVRWLAGRIPDEGMVQQTRTYIWLLPVLSTVGLACVGLGLLAAMVLYIVLLVRLRRGIEECRELAVRLAA